MDQKNKSDQQQRFIKSLMGQDSSEGSSSGFKPLHPSQETVLALTDPQKFNAYKHLKESHAELEKEHRQKNSIKV